MVGDTEDMGRGRDSSRAGAQADAVIFESLDDGRILVRFPYMRDSSECVGGPKEKEAEALVLHTQSNSPGLAGTTSLEEIDQLIERFLPADE